jgi:hypothetical protein
MWTMAKSEVPDYANAQRHACAIDERMRKLGRLERDNKELSKEYEGEKSSTVVHVPRVERRNLVCKPSCCSLSGVNVRQSLRPSGS